MGKNKMRSLHDGSQTSLINILCNNYIGLCTHHYQIESHLADGFHYIKQFRIGMKCDEVQTQNEHGMKYQDMYKPIYSIPNKEVSNKQISTAQKKPNTGQEVHR